jgi:hypothetical protein
LVALLLISTLMFLGQLEHNLYVISTSWMYWLTLALTGRK